MDEVEQEEAFPERKIPSVNIEDVEKRLSHRLTALEKMYKDGRDSSQNIPEDLAANEPQVGGLLNSIAAR